MCPLSKYFRISKNVGNIKLPIIYINRLFYDFASFLLFGNGRNHSIVFNIFLDDLINRRPGYADSFCNVTDWHSNRSQISIFSKSQFNNFYLHRKLNLRSVLQQFLKISYRQVHNIWILLFQDLVVAVVLHLLIELVSFLLDGLDHGHLWNYILWKVVFPEKLHLLILVIIIYNTQTSAPAWIQSFWFSLWVWNALFNFLPLLINLLILLIIFLKILNKAAYHRLWVLILN